MAAMNQSDPHNKDPHEPGAKLDAGKPRPALVLGGFNRALQAVTEVGTFGANKYTDNGWRSVPNGAERYTDAMLRHYFAESEGSGYDAESKLLHAAHLAWNALARLELLLLKMEKANVVPITKPTDPRDTFSIRSSWFNEPLNFSDTLGCHPLPSLKRK